MNWFTLEGIFCIFIGLIFVYCIFFTRKKKYKYIGLGTHGWTLINSKLIPEEIKSYKFLNDNVPQKKYGKFEEKCREVMEKLFNTTFSSVRPNWLKNPATGHNLELDCFNANIITPIGKGLALEADGRQHSEYVPHFHKKGPKEFIYQMGKDKWKDMMCHQHGILLIRVPYFIEFDRLEEFIKKKLIMRGMYVQ